MIRHSQGSNETRTTREELIEAGFQLLRKEGPAALRVRRVAKQANCSTMGVYTWFGDKDGLLQALWLDSFRRFGEALNRPSQVVEPLDRVRELMEIYRIWSLENLTDYQLMFGRIAPEYRPSEEARAEASRTFTGLAQAMSQLQANGLIRDGNVNEMAVQLWGAAHGIIEIGMADVSPVDVDLDLVYHDAIDALLLGFAPDESP